MSSIGFMPRCSIAVGKDHLIVEPHRFDRAAHDLHEAMAGLGRIFGLLLRAGLVRNAAGQRLKRHARLHVDQRKRARPHHRLRGLLEHVVVEQVDDLVPEAAFLQMRVDVDDQLVVVVGFCACRRPCAR